MHAQRTAVAGPAIVGVRLTAAAYARDLALAIPDKVVMARPTGFGRARTQPSFRIIPIEGAENWEAASSAGA
jgi:hypothetical protein